MQILRKFQHLKHLFHFILVRSYTKMVSIKLHDCYTVPSNLLSMTSLTSNLQTSHTENNIPKFYY